MKLTFVFLVLGALYFVSWVIQLASGAQETPEQRRARLQARAEAMRERMQRQGQRPVARPSAQAPQRPAERPEAQLLRTLERTLGLPAGSVAPPATPAPRMVVPDPVVVEDEEPEDHGGDLSQHHMRVTRDPLKHLAPSTVGEPSGGLSEHHLQTSFVQQAARPTGQRRLALGERLGHLNAMQRAVLMSEVLQPPVALRRRRR